MFYKIDPTRARTPFDLAADGFRVGDRIWVALRGDFQPTPFGSTAVADFPNTTFELGRASFFGGAPKTLTARDTVLFALNHDDPLSDNTDPDGDYGVLVRLAAFTTGDDFFRFGSRNELPEVRGSIYNARAGDDVVVMPDDPIPGFNHNRVFRTGAGDDEVRAGDLGMKVNFGRGTDTLAMKDAVVDWGHRENRDNDGVLLVTAGRVRYQVDRAEILEDRRDSDPLAKWYFKVVRERDGDCTVVFFENGERVARTVGTYDETKAIAGGRYEAILARPDGRGSEEIALLDVAGFRNVSIRDGGARNPRQDFVTGEDFMDTVFDHIRDAYATAGDRIPWHRGEATPVVPITVQLAGVTAGGGRVAALAADHDDAASPGADDFLL